MCGRMTLEPELITTVLWKEYLQKTDKQKEKNQKTERRHTVFKVKKLKIKNPNKLIKLEDIN